MAITRGKVFSVNVGWPREFEYNGRPARSAIWKSPVAGRVAARGINLAGDDQADRRAHGGPDKAVYTYAVEDLSWWAQQIGRPLQYGELGENLTTEGIAVNGALVGERWAIGTTVLEVSEPRVPCWRLGVRMNDKLRPQWKSSFLFLDENTFCRSTLGDVRSRTRQVSRLVPPSREVALSSARQAKRDP